MLKFSRPAFFVALTCFFCAASLSAQPDEQAPGMRHFTLSDGLPSSEIYCVIQDSKGYLWMGTDAGVCRYNGYTFEEFTTDDGLTDNTVFFLREDSAGRIWAYGFSGALSFYDGKRFNGIPANDELRKIYRNGQNLASYMNLEPGGGISTGGLGTCRNIRVVPQDGFSKLHHYTPPDARLVGRTTWVENGNAYLYSIPGPQFRNQPLEMFYNGHRTVIPLSFGATSEVTGNRAILTAGGKLLFSYDSLIYSMDRTGYVAKYKMPAHISNIEEDRNGNVWVSYRQDGVAFYPGGNLEAVPRNFIPGQTISCVFADKDGGHWFATIGNGLYYLPDIGFNYLTNNAGLPQRMVRTIAPWTQGVILGQDHTTVSRVMVTPAGAAVRYLNLEDNSYNTIETIWVKNDTILVHLGKFTYLDTALNVITESDPDRIGRSTCLTINPVDSSAAFSNHAGFYWFDNFYTLDSVQLVYSRFTATCYDHTGKLWLGALNGLWKYEDGQPFYCGDSAFGIKYRIDDIAEDRSQILWLATRGDGIFATDGKSQKWHFRKEDGLASNTCRTIVTDEEGRVWVATNRGVTMINGFDRETGKARMRNFNRKHGLLSDEVNCMLIDKGILWMGTNDGLSWVRISDLLREPASVTVYISSVLYGKTSVPLNVTTEFPYSENAVRVFIEGLYFRDPERLRYRYRLVGDNTGEWITTENREISFTGLSPGRYTLEVVAVTPDGKTSVKQAKYSFSIATPFWMSWWFFSAIGLVLVMIALLVAGARARRLRKRAQEKAYTEKRIAELRLAALRAQMNPHFIFNAINSIQHFILKNDSDQAYDYLAKFSRLIRMVLDQSQSERIPLSRELDILNLYIGLEQLRFERPFRCVIDVDPELLEEGISLPGMLVQPFVENAIWHGLLPKKEGEAIVKILFQDTNHGLKITIEDNGVGRKAHEDEQKDFARQPHGMRITGERLVTAGNAQSETNLRITDLYSESGEPAGTRVEIEIVSAREEAE